MKTKAEFSPWQTKNNSFQQDQHQIIYQSNSKPNHQSKLKKQSSQLKCHKLFQNKLSSRKKPIQQQNNHSIVKSFSKTQTVSHFNHNDSQMSHNIKINKSLNKRTKTSQKSHRAYENPYKQKQEDKNGKQFDDQKWKILALCSNDRFKSQCPQIRKYKNLVTQIKSRGSVRSNLPNSAKQSTLVQKQKPFVLQQVCIKNFIIHGHYTDKDSFYQMNKRRQTSYVMKQKFATLKKTIDNNYQGKENEYGGKKVIVKGNKQKQNLFKVIKLQRQINNVNNKIL